MRVSEIRVKRIRVNQGLGVFYGNEANCNKPLKNKKISGIERLALPFSDTFTS